MKKIFCLINIEEKGVHALFCRLGWHSWLIDYSGGDGTNFFVCAYCPQEKKVYKK